MLAVVHNWRIRVLMFACAGLAAISTAMAADTSASARHLVETVMSEVVHELEARRDAIRDDSTCLDEIVERLVIPHFDLERMSRRVLRKRWNGASVDQQTRFIAAFRTTLVQTYAAVLGAYDGQSVAYLEPVPRKKEGEVVVPVQITGSGGQPIRVAYAMHQPAAGWKVFDVAVDGISIVMTFRSSFRSKIARDGIDALISNLEEKNMARGS